MSAQLITSLVVFSAHNQDVWLPSALQSEWQLKEGKMLARQLATKSDWKAGEFETSIQHT
jgi:hypothetical protein